MPVSYIGAGTSYVTQAAQSVSVFPTHVAGDFLMLFVATPNNGAITISGGTAGTWTPLTQIGTGSANAAASIRLACWYKFTSGSEAAVTVDDVGDAHSIITLCYRGVDTTTPINVFTTDNNGGVAETNLDFPIVTTTVANCMCIFVAGVDKDANDTDNAFTLVNANLTSRSERHDRATSLGWSAGMVIFDGLKATAGSIGATTATGDASQVRAYYTIALAPSVGFSLVCASGSYAITGTAADLRATRRITGDSGSYALTGTDASLLFNRLLAADSGSYSLVGTDVVLTYDPATPTGYTIVCDSGSYSLAGTDASLLFNRFLTASPGSFILTGQDVNLRAGRKLFAEAGSYSLTGQDAALLFNRLLAAESGSFTLSGTDIDFLRDYVIQAESGEYFLNGAIVDLLYSAAPPPDVNGGYLIPLRRRRKQYGS